MSDLDLFGHSNDTDWFFFWPYRGSVVETHDGFFEDIEKGLLSIGMYGVRLVDLWEKIPALETEFGGEEDLFGVVPVLVIELSFEGHGR